MLYAGGGYIETLNSVARNALDTNITAVREERLGSDGAHTGAREVHLSMYLSIQTLVLAVCTNQSDGGSETKHGTVRWWGFREGGRALHRSVSLRRGEHVIRRVCCCRQIPFHRTPPCLPSLCRGLLLLVVVVHVPPSRLLTPVWSRLFVTVFVFFFLLA